MTSNAYPLSDILQYSGIAWPNPGIWKQAPQGVEHHALIGTRPAAAMDYDAHAHSPRRSMYNSKSFPCFNDPAECVARNCAHPIHYASVNPTAPPLYQSSWAPSTAAAGNVPQNPMSTCDDPFVGPPPAPTIAKRFSTSHNVFMPDYSWSKSGHSRAYTDMSGISYHPKNIEESVNEAETEEIIKAPSPGKANKLIQGTQPPMKTSSGWPPSSHHVSPALPARVASHGPSGGQNVSLDVNPRLDLSRSTAASLRPEHPLSKFLPPRDRHSPDGSRTSKETTVVVGNDDNLPFESSVTAQNQSSFASNGAAQTRDPSDETIHHRSKSNASKRKRSLSMEKDIIGKRSPANSKARI